MALDDLSLQYGASSFNIAGATLAVLAAALVGFLAWLGRALRKAIALGLVTAKKLFDTYQVEFRKDLADQRKAIQDHKEFMGMMNGNIAALSLTVQKMQVRMDELVMPELAAIRLDVKGATTAFKESTAALKKIDDFEAWAEAIDPRVKALEEHRDQNEEPLGELRQAIERKKQRSGK